MGYNRIPGIDYRLEGTARSIETLRGYRPPSAARTEGNRIGSDFTPEERDLLLDMSQVIFDLIGVADPTGGADAMNASISFSRGDTKSGWIGVMAIVPVIGDLAKQPLIAKHLATINSVIQHATHSTRFCSTVLPTLRALSSILDKLDTLSGQVGKVARELNEPLTRCLRKTAEHTTKAPCAVAPVHIPAFLRVAHKRNVYIVMRSSNVESLKWMARGFPSKPLEVKCNTGSDGLVNYLVSKTGDDSDAARRIKELNDMVSAELNVKLSKELDDILSSNYGVLNIIHNKFVIFYEDKAPRKNKAPREILSKPFVAEGFIPKTGHVVHLGLNRPLTADYDLLAVIDPNDPSINKVTLRMGDGNPVARSLKETSGSNAFDDEVIRELNSAMGEPRILHGADERFKTVGSRGENVTVFFPDGVNYPTLPDNSEEFLKSMRNFR